MSWNVLQTNRVAQRKGPADEPKILPKPKVVKDFFIINLLVCNVSGFETLRLHLSPRFSVLCFVFILWISFKI